LTLGTVTVIGVIVVAALIWFYVRTRRADQLSELIEKRRAGSKLVARAEYVEGLNKMPVAIALTGDTFYYENADLQASFELARIDEVEYDNELTTGRSVDADSRALRLRSHGATFEFILPNAEASKWQVALPPKRLDQSTARVV
jgi:hypothetical protein